MTKLRDIGPSTDRARELVERLRRAEMFCGPLSDVNHLFAEAADFIEQSLTPPEGDRVSEGAVEQLIVAVHALIVATDGMEALRPQRQAALDAMERAARCSRAGWSIEKALTTPVVTR